MAESKAPPEAPSSGPPPPKPAVPEWVWAPLASGLLMLAAGGTGLLVHQPLLFPSLGPTAFLQSETPDQPSAKWFNVVVGHLLGLLSGFLAVWAFGLVHAPSVLSTNDLSPARVWASALAVVLTLFAGLLVHAPHPPAAATTLLASLGGFPPTWHSTLTVMSGVLIVAALGEGLRRLRLSQRPPSTRPSARPGRGSAR